MRAVDVALAAELDVSLAGRAPQLPNGPVREVGESIRAIGYIYLYGIVKPRTLDHVFVVLGTLHLGARSGYEVKRWIERWRGSSGRSPRCRSIPR